MSLSRSLSLLVALAASSPAVADPVTITDHEGRTVSLPRAADRIASIPIPMASTLIAIDGGPTRLAGMNPTAKSAIVEGILGRIFPEARGIPSDITAPNFIPNVEELAATNPDLVIQWAGRGADYVDPITNAGLPALLISYGTETRTREYMAMAGVAMGKAERVKDLNAWRERVERDLARRGAAIPAERRPKVLYLLRARETLTASGARENYNTWAIELAGGVSASADLEGQGATVSAEQIAAWDPDVILLNSFEAELDRTRILGDPVLSLTKAARDGRVYKMPLGGYRWDPPSQESPLAWMWLANLLHPDVFAYDLRQEMGTAYRLLYGHDLDAAEIDEILRIAEQGDSALYAQFRAKP